LKAIKPERDRMLQQVAAHTPDIVVAFGPTAAKALWGKGVKVANLRHKLHTLPDVAAPVWVTNSLEEASIKPGLVKFMGIDLLHAAKGETDVRWRTHIVTDHRSGPDPRLDLGAAVASVDLETYPGTDARVPTARIRMAVVSTDAGFAQVIQAGPASELPEWLTEWLASGRTLWGGSNIAFDWFWLQRFGYTLKNFVCTSHLQHILDENSAQKDLKSLVLIHTDIGDYSREQRDYVEDRGGWEFVTDAEMYQYAGADGYGGYEVLTKQLAAIRERGLEKAMAVHKATYPAIAKLQYAGAHLDLQENARLSERYVTALSRLTMDARKVLGPINLNSPTQLVPALKTAVPGLDLTEWFWKHQDDEEEKFSTKKAILEREARKHPVLATVLEYRRRETLRRFIDGIHKHVVDRGPRGAFVYTNIRGDVTVTHRLSSSKPNMQNLPRDTEGELAAELNVKRQYVSRFPGGSITEGDESQLELRVAAIISGDRAMHEAFLRGTDVHTELAAMMRRIQPAQVTKEVRQAGKTTNFHVLYGGQAFGLGLRLGCSKAEAQELIDQFYATFPDFEGWQRETEAFAKKHLYVESMFGRRRHFVRPDDWKGPAGKRILRQAVNSPIQGDASAITNIGIAQAVDRMSRERMRSVMFLTVHDSGVVDNYPGEEEAVAQILREEMEHPDTEQFGVRLTLPLVVDIKTGPSWGAMREIK